MPFFSPDEKRSAQAAQAAYENHEVSAAFAGAAAAAVALTIGAAAVVPPLAVVAGLCVAGSKYLAHRNKRMAEDPPDPEYGAPVSISFRFIREAEVGDTPIEQVGARLADALFRAGGSVEGVVTAAERIDGARLAQRAASPEDDPFRAEEARLYDLQKFAKGGVDAFHDIVTHGEALMRALRLEDIDGPKLTSEMRAKILFGEPFSATLSGATLQRLERAGVEREDLWVPIQDLGPQPLLIWADRVSGVIAASQEMAGVLDRYVETVPG